MTEVMTPPATPAAFDLQSKYQSPQGRIYLTGLQALVRVILDQVRADRRADLDTRAYVSGYPGSPLAGLDLELESRATLLEEAGVVHRPGLNEELAATSVMGSQIAMRFGRRTADGVVGFWYGKAPGLDRAADAIRHANYFGTTRHSGVLAFVGDDPTCKSSSVPSSSESLLADLYLPTLAPGTVQEVLDFGLHGVALSRVSSLWTGFKVVTAIADGAGSALVSPDRVRPILPTDADGRPLGRDEPSTLAPPQILAVERQIHEVRLPAALAYARLNGLNEITHATDDAWLGIIAPGHLYYETLEALRQLGLEGDELARRGIRLLRLGMVNPLDADLVREFARGLSEIVVVEDKGPRLEHLVRDALYRVPDAPLVLGKTDEDGRPLLRTHGALDADEIGEPLHGRLGRRLDPAVLRTPPRVKTRLALPIIPRTPYFCSGCPHNTSLKVPDGAMVGAGIGCHSMVSFMAPEMVGTITGVTQMGGEGAQWIGAAPFVDTDHIFQNLGEGTFFHSGEMAVRASVAAGTHVTYKILYNRAVAMTGGQEANGLLEVPDMARLLLDVGVSKVIITTEDRSRYRGRRLPAGVSVLGREKILEAQEELRGTPGTTVLIHDQQCAAEARRLRKRGRQPEPAARVVINERVCEGCGDCGEKSNCLSVRPVDTEFGQKTVIDQSSCNKDFSCLRGDCPSFTTIVPIRMRGSRDAQAKGRAAPVAGGAAAGGAAAGGVAGSGAVTAATRGPAQVGADELPEPTSIVSTDDYRVRMPGIGGTGVVTVAQILGTAALLDGRYVSGLDQTGLAQKGGAVVSDLRVTREALPTSTKLPAGAVDLYLAFDLIVGVMPANLSGASTERTVVVASLTETPTGRMIGTTARQPAPARIREVLAETSRREDSVYVDMAGLAEALFGRSTSANILGLGIAYQLGAVPVTAASIERALDLNGVAVRANIQAFRWGRLYVHDRARVEAAVAAASSSAKAVAGAASRGKAEQSAPGDRATGTAVSRLAGLLPADPEGGPALGGELGRLVAIRYPDLVAFQNEALARRYLDVVRRVARAEERTAPGSTALAEAVARNLYKLLAYKDEYEVARLQLDAAERERIRAVAGGERVKVVWHLHPPLLRAMGMSNKLRLGPWFAPAYQALRAMRGLRGTPFDIFGYAEVRRTERALITEYLATVDELLARLAPATLAVAVRIAELPDMVRGYEEIKMASVRSYREKQAAELAAFAAAGTDQAAGDLRAASPPPC